MSAVNAEGPTLQACLFNVDGRVASRGFQVKAALALASVQFRSGHDLRFPRPIAPFDKDKDKRLYKSFEDEAFLISLYVDSEKVAKSVFD